MKRELTEEKEKKTSFSTDYKKQTNSKLYFNNQNRPNNTNSGYDNRRYGKNTILIITNPMNKNFPKTTNLVPMKLKLGNIMNVRIRIFNVFIPPPTFIIINSKHQAVDIMINNPARSTLFTG